MEDERIIELYFARDDSAITESSEKYGPYCSSIALNILNSREDSEECVNDTWLRAWNAIPPARPLRLSIFLGRITRNLALDRYRSENSQKHRDSQTALCLDELSECIGKEEYIEDQLILKDQIERFLRALPSREKDIFLYRYWYFLSAKEIAQRYKISEAAIKMKLMRTRKKLQEFLDKEGV
jgi:RNA polymerase sigma-70 factor (ECF subfamily)